MKKLFSTLFIIILIFSALPVLAANNNSGPRGLQKAWENLLGGDEDEHGCNLSAGYSWCEAKQKCLRPWEEECTSLEDSPQIQKREQVQEHVQEQLQKNASTTAIQVQIRNVIRARTLTQLREAIQTQRQQMAEETAGFKSSTQQKVFANQNKVREAVHALLSSEDLLGGIGPEVSAIAQEFNNSLINTVAAEESIKDRSWFTKFFIGGDLEAAAEIRAIVKANRDRIKELRQLQDESTLQTEISEILSEQLENLESEQNRLEDLADSELKTRGLFGWLVNLFR